MRYPLLFALAIAIPVAAAPTGPGGPADPASAASPIAPIGLPPMFEPVLREEGSAALERSDTAGASTAATATGKHQGQDPKTGARQ